MAEIKFDKIQIFNYFDQNNIQVKDDERSFINSIFDECDVENIQGQKESDGILSRDEVRNFMQKVLSTLENLAQDFINFINGIANEDQEQSQIQGPQEPQTNREIKQIGCKRSEQEQATYRQNLQEAKDLCNQNKEQLGLSDSELEFINNADLVSEAYGAARFDGQSNKLLFNLNSEGDISTGTLLKVLIHEATHATINSDHNSKNEERKCETRALAESSELFKQGEINDFEIINGSGIYISQLDTEDKIAQFVEMWLSMGYNDLPEN